MKKVKILYGIIFIICFITRLSGQGDGIYSFDCFSIIVGRDASVDGSVIMGHNEDTGTPLINYYKVPEAEHVKGDSARLKNGGHLPQVPRTCSYFWINLPVCDCCDTYMNEYGVAVASDGCPSREEYPDLTDGGIVWWLRRALAGRARSAREAVKIAGRLIEYYGYASSGRSYLIADPAEAWMLSVVYGRHWVAKRLPDDEIAVIPNSYTINEVNLYDTVNYLGSADLVDYAGSRGWYNTTDGSFSFAKAYSNPGSLIHPDNIRRTWLATEMLSGRNYPIDFDELPFSFKPEKKISVQDVMRVLRSHGEGTGLDRSELYTRGSPHRNSGAICGGGTQYSVVAHLRSWLPGEIGPVMLVAPFRPDVNVYQPWYPSMTEIPRIYAKGDHHMALTRHFDMKNREADGPHAFRSFVALADTVDHQYNKHIWKVQKTRDVYERITFRAQAAIEKKALSLLEKDRDKAIRILTNSINKLALWNLKQVEKLSETLK